jgi:hypothetical protein
MTSRRGFLAGAMAVVVTFPAWPAAAAKATITVHRDPT